MQDSRLAMLKEIAAKRKARRDWDLAKVKANRQAIADQLARDAALEARGVRLMEPTKRTL